MENTKNKSDLSILILSSTPDICSDTAFFPGRECRPVPADSMLKALDMLARTAYDVLMIDLEMFRKDLVQLLIRAKKMEPRLHPVILTDTEERLPSGAIAEKSVISYIPKNLSGDDFGHIIRKRSETLRWQKSPMNLFDLVILYTVCLETIQLTVCPGKNREKESGEIYFENGIISSASSGNRLGEDAFYEIMTWTEARFRERKGVRAKQRDITRSRDDLLMEVIRHADMEMRMMETQEFNLADSDSELSEASAETGDNENDTDELADFAYRMGIARILKELREKTDGIDNALITDMQGNMLAAPDTEKSAELKTLLGTTLEFCGNTSKWPADEGLEELILFSRKGIRVLFPVSGKGILAISAHHQNFGMIREDCESFLKRLEIILR